MKPLLAVVMGFRAGIVAGVVTLAAGIVAQILYLRWFPRMSRWMGYGSVSDVPAAAVPVAAPWPRVTFYTANVCPFCPIVRRRLADLQRQHPFEVDEIDVTFTGTVDGDVMTLRMQVAGREAIALTARREGRGGDLR